MSTNNAHAPSPWRIRRRLTIRKVMPNSNIIPGPGGGSYKLPLNGGAGESDNFSFANFDWLGYNDTISASENGSAINDEMLKDTNVGNAADAVIYKWIPFTMELNDGSSTIAVKMANAVADEFARTSASSDPADAEKAQKLLIDHSIELLTTPSKVDRMRGTPASTFVVRTPSSLIDLLDDQVPDLREGLYMDSQDPSVVQAFAGDPASSRLLTGNPAYWIYLVASELYNDLKARGVSMNLDNVIKIVQGLPNIMLGSPQQIMRIIECIRSGELDRYLDAHRNEDVLSVIMGLFESFMFGSDLVDSGRGLENPGEWLDRNHTPSEPGLSLGAGQQDDMDERRGKCDCGCLHPQDFYSSPDRDVAYVPVSYWRWLYSMGSCFRKRNAIPNFSKLVLTGSPATDLLVNRVPEIYIYPDGRITNHYWQYGTYPLAGGLFKKIKNAVKKVGSVVKKVTKAVAKGVAKVMDGPLGGVIGAIPIVGNIANVAGKVAKGAVKVMDKIDAVKDKIKSKVGGKVGKLKDAVSNKLKGSKAGQLLEDATSSEEEEVSSAPSSVGDSSDNAAVRGASSDVIVGENAANPNRISVQGLPVWESKPTEEYSAPTLSMLTGDAYGLPMAAKFPFLLSNSDVLLDNERLLAEAVTRLGELDDFCGRMEDRGPLVLCDFKIKYPEAFATGDPNTRDRSRRIRRANAASWNKGGRIHRARRSKSHLAGDPDVEEQILATTLPALAPMAAWTGLPSLTQISSQLNPYASVFFQLSQDNDTAGIIAKGRFNASAAQQYLFQPTPLIQRIKGRQQDPAVVLASAIAWAMLLVSAKNLTDSHRSEIAAVMSKAAITGLWTNKGIDSLVALAVKGEWPASSEINQKAVGKSWVRMVAGAILFAWYEAGTSTLNPFAQAICEVQQPSIDITAAMGNLMLKGSASESATSGSKNSDPVATVRKEAVPRLDAHNPGGTPSQAQNLFQNWEASVEFNQSQGPSDDSDPSTSLQNPPLSPITLDREASYSRFEEPPALLRQIDSRSTWDGAGDIYDYWAEAIQICKSALNEDSARLRMLAARIPSLFISLALQRFFPTRDFNVSPMSAIPLTRSDYILYGR